jgi:hypothetical protein
MKNNLLTTLIICLFTISCNNQGNPKIFDYGQVENMKYTNTYFDFEITLPDDWKFQSKDQLDNLNNRGRDLLAGDNETLKTALKASEINNAILLSANQYEAGAPVDYNPSISIVAENIKNFPGIKNGSDYLFQVRKLLIQSQVKYEYVDSTFSKETINEFEFFKLNAGLNSLGINIYQIYYSTILNGFSLGIIISYNTEQQKSDMLEALNSIKFIK